MVEQKYKTKQIKAILIKQVEGKRLFLITNKIITPKAKIIDPKIKEARVTM